MRRWKSLERTCSGFKAAMGLFSCEEAVQDVREYVGSGESPAAVEGGEKEHVMVGVHVLVEGRVGLLLADPGYHVPRVVTVMADRAYPHTGRFTQSEEAHCRKEYTYTFNRQHPGYVEWHERETRGDLVKCQTSLVYVARHYLDSVNVTERRNLVYNFKSLLSRDQKGHLIAGLYFPVGARANDAHFTIFYDAGDEKKKIKYKFTTFRDRDNIPESIVKEVNVCNSQLNYKDGELLSIICKLAEVLSCERFVEQLSAINDDICRLSVN